MSTRRLVTTALIALAIAAHACPPVTGAATETDEARIRRYKAIQQHTDVTVTVWDAANPYRYAEVRGTVAGEVRGDQARAHIDTLSQRYLGHDYGATIQSERVVLRIRPVRQRANGL